MTSTYAFESAEAGSEMFRGERPGYIYGRTRNPTQALLEQKRMASVAQHLKLQHRFSLYQDLSRAPYLQHST